MGELPFHEIAEAFVLQLGWTSCELVSVSGGTPFLFRFARASKLEIRRLVIVSGLAALGAERFRNLLGRRKSSALRLFPLLPGFFLSRIFPAKVRPGPGFLLIRSFLPASPADQVTMRDPETQAVLLQVLQEAFHQGGRGPRRDARDYLMNRDWGFDLGSVPVEVWHGEEDLILPSEMARRMAEDLKGSRLHLVNGEGHYSLIIRRTAEILRLPGENSN